MLTHPVQLTLWPSAPPRRNPYAGLPVGTCLACGVVTDPATLEQDGPYPVWPLRHPCCGAYGAGWILFDLSTEDAA